LLERAKKEWEKGRREKGKDDYITMDIYYSTMVVGD